MRHEENTIRKIVHMENELRKVTNFEANRFKALLRGFIGQKIVTQTGDFTAPVKKAIEAAGLTTEAIRGKWDPDLKPIPVDIAGDAENQSFADLHCFYVSKDHTCLFLKVSLCFSGGHYNNNPRTPTKYTPQTAYTDYREASIYLGDKGHNQNANTLEKVADDETQDLIDAQEEIDRVKTAQDAREVFEAAIEKVLPDFSAYVRDR